MDVDRAARIAAITNHPGWEALVAEVQERYDAFKRQTIDKLMSSGETYPDFEYERGYWAGLLMVTRYPGRATTVVAKDAAKQLREEQGE